VGEGAAQVTQDEVEEREARIAKVAEAIFVRMPHDTDSLKDEAPQLAGYAFRCAETFVDLVETRRMGK
jgi:hypothetical protein